MELKDLFLTPIYLIIIYAIAFNIRKKYTNKFTRKYFIPALTVKIIGAISLGLIYQFYYSNGTLRGDTAEYFKQSKIVTQALVENPAAGIKLLLSNREYDPETAQYSERMYWYRSPTEFFVIKFAAALGLFSFNTYAVTAIFFAILSFTGMWAMYSTFLKMYPTLYKQFAYACFFLPSVFFWGSGLMKDSITIGALGWLFYGFYQLFIAKKRIIYSIIITLISIYFIQAVKAYILLSFIPPALYWIISENNSKIKNAFIQKASKPLFIIVGILVSAVGAAKITEGDKKFDIDKIAERTKINSEYLSEYVATGSAYNIGSFDGTFTSMVKVAPQAIVVALYRPFIWEVRNPVMLLSAIEATLFIFLTIQIAYKIGILRMFSFIGTKPVLTFCFIFSLIFAFGVGTNSGNFGTLVRYKIPLMPFYLSALYIMQAHLKRPKKSRRIAVTA